MKTIKFIFAISLLIVLQFSSCQTIEKLEKELSWFKSGEQYGDKISDARKLLKLDPLNTSAIKYISEYIRDRKEGSVSDFMNELEKQHPSSEQLVIYRAEHTWLEYDRRTSDSLQMGKQLEILRKGKARIPASAEVLFHLGNIFYNDFLRDYYIPPPRVTFIDATTNEDITEDLFTENRKPKKHTYLANSVDSAYLYFTQAANLDSELRNKLYFPLEQIRQHLNSETEQGIPVIKTDGSDCYFPAWYFLNLDEEWRADKSKDLVFELITSNFPNTWLESQLTGLQEPCLTSMIGNDSTSIYRFSFLPSFNRPFSIRIIINKDGRTIIHWKIGKGAGGYEPQGIYQQGVIALPSATSAELIQQLNELQLDTFPNYSNLASTDGALWTIEKKINGKFKAHATNTPENKVKKIFRYCLKLVPEIDKNEYYRYE